MQSPAAVSKPSLNPTDRGEHTSPAEPDRSTFGQEKRHLRQPRAFPSASARRSNGDALVVGELGKNEDEQLDDLIFSWRRLTDPKLKKLAIRIIQSMAA